MSETRVGRLFIRARAGRPLRAIEEMTGVNRETWRLIELGETKEPGMEAMQGAAKLPGAPDYREFVAAFIQDQQERLAAPRQEAVV